MCMTSDEAVKVTAFLRLSCTSQYMEGRFSPRGSASVFDVCVEQYWLDTVHTVSLSPSSCNYYFCLIVFTFI